MQAEQTIARQSALEFDPQATVSRVDWLALVELLRAARFQGDDSLADGRHKSIETLEQVVQIGADDEIERYALQRLAKLYAAVGRQIDARAALQKAHRSDVGPDDFAPTRSDLLK